MLTASQVQSFTQQGFIVLEGALPQAEVESIRSAALRIVEQFDVDQHRTVFSTSDRDRGRDSYFMDSAENVSCFLEADALDDNGQLVKPKQQCINKMGHAMHDLVPEFTAFCKQPLFGELLRDIGYQAPHLMQTMYIFKQPQIGGEVRWHQDASYLISNPPSVTGVWVAVEDAHQGNGCLWVQPRGHKSPLREVFEVDTQRQAGALKTLDNTPWPEPDQAVAVEVPAGSIVVFSDHLPHYSSHNYSDTSRHAFTLHVVEQAARWSDKNWLQRPNLGIFAL